MPAWILSDRLLSCGEQEMNRDSAQNQSDKYKQTSLRSDRSAREPVRAMKDRIQKMTLGHAAAVRHGIEKRLSPIPSGVHADRKPETSGAPQRECGEQAEAARRERADPGFARISKLQTSK